MTEKLEILTELKKRYLNLLNPAIESIKFCQNERIVFVETLFANNYPAVINKLGFIADDDDLDKILFQPERDIIDNARLFLELDKYTLLISIDNLFTKNAEVAICKELEKL